MDSSSHPTLGINGLGRIGKLTLWHHVARKQVERIVINVGRKVGNGLEAVCGVIEKDSSYGRMHHFLWGIHAEPCIRIVDRERNLLEVGGIPVQILDQARNPRDIAWRDHGVRVVVDTTGAFGDPTVPADAPGGSLRGHLEAGADVVLNSSAFKIKDKAQSWPDDAATLIYGINHQAYEPGRHKLVSAASCTTTALAHMLHPLMTRLENTNIMTASMSTVHATTNSQQVLDTVPKAGAKDLRRNRSVLNNVILTSTNAARALEYVIPEIKQIGFMATSVRVPTSTVSLIILNVTFQRLGGGQAIDRETLNRLYRAVADENEGLLLYTEEQNVPMDMAGMRAAVVMEAAETLTLTGNVTVDLQSIPHLNGRLPDDVPGEPILVPVTHAKLFGWYDNEYGSYTNMLGELTCHVADNRADG